MCFSKPGCCGLLNLPSVTGSLGQAVGMDDSPLHRCGNDVVETASSMDDLDGPVDRAKARYVGPDQGGLLVHNFRVGFKKMTCVVLELGTFTGVSALAWYDGTRANQAEIVTLDVRADVVERTRAFFKQLGVDDRITPIAGPAAETSV